MLIDTGCRVYKGREVRQVETCRARNQASITFKSTFCLINRKPNCRKAYTTVHFKMRFNAVVVLLAGLAGSALAAPPARTFAQILTTLLLSTRNREYPTY